MQPIAIRPSDRYLINGALYHIVRTIEKTLTHARTQTTERVKYLELVTVAGPGAPVRMTIAQLKGAIAEGQVQQILKSA